MAADKLKKLEARGRAAFTQGDLSAATRYFTQALEKKHSIIDSRKTPEHINGFQKREAVGTKAESTPTVNIDDGDKVWILQSSPRGNRSKEGEKSSKRKGKHDKDIMSGIEILDGIIAEADTSIKSYPSYPLSYLRKASALIILNHWDEARKTYITGLSRCPEKSILKSALLSLNKTLKITSLAAMLDFEKLSNLVNQNGPSPRTSLLPATTSTLRKNKFRLRSQRRLTKKMFNSEDEDISSQIKVTRYRRRNSSSTDTHF